MTVEAFARRTNVPLEIVRTAISRLERPDPRSRTPDEDGKRLVRLDEHREWGWHLVNHAKYRGMKSDGDRRAYMRDYMRERRKQESKQEFTKVNSASASASSSALSGEGDAGKGVPAAPDRMPPDGWTVETVMEMAANPTVGCPRAAAEAYFACRARTDPPWTMDGKNGARAVGRTLTALRHDLVAWARVTWPNMQADAERRTGAKPRVLGRE
jgi:hypothetical protein